MDKTIKEEQVFRWVGHPNQASFSGKVFDSGCVCIITAYDGGVQGNTTQQVSSRTAGQDSATMAKQAIITHKVQHIHGTLLATYQSPSTSKNIG